MRDGSDVVSSIPMPKRLLLAILLAAAPTGSIAAVPAAAALSPAAEPLQFYVFSFTDTPAAEAAQDVVVGALAHDLDIDPAVEGVVTFRADGWYSGDALLRDFGTALLDQDLALVRTGRGAYALVPRTNAAILMARGGVVMQLSDAGTVRAPVAPASETAPSLVRETKGWWSGAAAALVLFFAGAAAGAAALFAGQATWRRATADPARLAAPVRRLSDRSPAPQPRGDAISPDPDLVIPRFEDRA